MRKVLWCGVAAFVGVTVWVIVTKPTRPSNQPEPFRPIELGKCVERTARLDFRARISFELALTPTADPTIYTYHPGRPAERVRPTHRIHFTSDPGDIRRAVTIVGTVRAFEPDTFIRPSGLHGVTVVVSAEVE